MPLTAEDRAREQIDAHLAAAGWVVQDYAAMNLAAGRGVAVREFPLGRGFGFADYLLYGDRKALGTVEAKKVGETLTGVEVQSEKYSAGLPLEKHYRRLLEELGRQSGTLGVIFRKAQNRIQDPAKLRRLVVDLIDRERWTLLDADVKGDAYEGLLEKNAQDTKSGAGQYFTPRPLIRAMVDVICPRPDTLICDPACGTGGFLLAAYDYIARHYPLDRDQKEHLRDAALHGWEIVDNAARLCAMNLFLHGIGEKECPIHVDDALRSDPGERFDLVLTNPPFGKKSSITVVGEDGDARSEALTYVRDDFWATTSNKQLNFVQHVNEELLQRDKVSLDLFWLRDESLEDSANLPDPDVLAAEIAEDLQAALDQFAQIAEELSAKPA